jgi:hypothetical protein
MASPARAIEVERPVEERTIRLEERVEHMQSDITDIKGDVRRVDAKVDAVKDSVVSLRIEMKDGFARIEAAMADLRLGRAWDRVWWLLITGGTLALIARAFKWI